MTPAPACASALPTDSGPTSNAPAIAGAFLATAVGGGAPAAGRAQAIVLVAHGSRDPAAARATLALRDAVAAARPGQRVLAAFLDFAGPRLAASLAEVGGAAVVVPLLLTEAYHGRVDVPGEVARARADGATGVLLAPVLGPVGGAVDDAEILDLLVSALINRAPVIGGVDGVVLAGAGSRHLDALHTVDVAATALGAALGVPALAGYASGAGRSVTEAVDALRAGGAARVALASYFLAPGRLYDRAVEQARAAGVMSVAPPLGSSPELVRAVLYRADGCAAFAT